MSSNGTRQLTIREIINEIQPNICFIEQWEKQAVIGRGSVGKVVSCKNLDNGHIIAGKFIGIALPTAGILPVERAAIKKDLETVLKEIKIMLKLDHERVLKCHGYGTDEDSLIIFTDLMKCSVLDEMRMTGTVIDTKAAMEYAKQATEGLVYLHSCGVIHRDVKCANLLLDQNKTVKLADFGISVVVTLKNGLTFSTFTGDDKSKGTLLHMAPEVQMGTGFSRKSDVWSMGCTIVEMLTTMAPHQEKTINAGWDPTEFKNRVNSGKLTYIGGELCPGAPIAIQNLLNKIFLKSVEKRLSSEQLLKLITDFLNELEVKEKHEREVMIKQMEAKAAVDASRERERRESEKEKEREEQEKEKILQFNESVEKWKQRKIDEKRGSTQFIKSESALLSYKMSGQSLVEQSWDFSSPYSQSPGGWD